MRPCASFTHFCYYTLTALTFVIGFCSSFFAIIAGFGIAMNPAVVPNSIAVIICDMIMSLMMLNFLFISVRVFLKTLIHLNYIAKGFVLYCQRQCLFCILIGICH